MSKTKTRPEARPISPTGSAICWARSMTELLPDIRTWARLNAVDAEDALLNAQLLRRRAFHLRQIRYVRKLLLGMMGMMTRALSSGPADDHHILPDDARYTMCNVRDLTMSLLNDDLSRREAHNELITNTTRYPVGADWAALDRLVTAWADDPVAR
jgi:hypothetical protein